MKRKRGLFIVFEGIDGCGSSTALVNLARKLPKPRPLETREPWNDEEIRRILREHGADYNARELAQLFVDDRRNHLYGVILPNITHGLDVFSDRYALSTCAYQAAQPNGPTIDELIAMHNGMAIPDLTFLIDVPVEVAAKRMKKRKRDKFEKNKKFQNRVRDNYLQLAEMPAHENIVIIDGTSEIRVVAENIEKVYESQKEQLERKRTKLANIFFNP